jgi:hypothetical protein
MNSSSAAFILSFTEKYIDYAKVSAGISLFIRCARVRPWLILFVAYIRRHDCKPMGILEASSAEERNGKDFPVKAILNIVHAFYPYSILRKSWVYHIF